MIDEADRDGNTHPYPYSTFYPSPTFYPYCLPLPLPLPLPLLLTPTPYPYPLPLPLTPYPYLLPLPLPLTPTLPLTTTPTLTLTPTPTLTPTLTLTLTPSHPHTLILTLTHTHTPTLTSPSPSPSRPTPTRRRRDQRGRVPAHHEEDLALLGTLGCLQRTTRGLPSPRPCEPAKRTGMPGSGLGVAGRAARRVGRWQRCARCGQPSCPRWGEGLRSGSGVSHVYRVCVRVQGVFSRALFNDQNEGVVTCTPFACRRRSTFHTPVRRDGAPELEARYELPRPSWQTRWETFWSGSSRRTSPPRTPSRRPRP